MLNGAINTNLMRLGEDNINSLKASVANLVSTPKSVQKTSAPTNLSTDKIQSVINQYGGGKSPLTAQDYIKVSTATGVPVDALLTQGALEGNFSTKGLAKTTNNPGNVGNTDSGATRTFSSQYEGLLAQANLLKNEYNYQGGFSADKFIQNNFTRPRGGRYASDPKYGEKYSSILKIVRNKL